MAAIPDTQEHLRRRRPWARGLAPSALKDYEQLIRKRVQQLVRLVDEQDGEVVLNKWFDYFRCVSVYRELP